MAVVMAIAAEVATEEKAVEVVTTAFQVENGGVRKETEVRQGTAVVAVRARAAVLVTTATVAAEASWAKADLVAAGLQEAIALWQTLSGLPVAKRRSSATNLCKGGGGVG